MQRGITVKLPITTNAVVVPNADKQGALLVTVARDGSVYLGVNLTSTSELAEKLRSALSTRTEKTLYIKADERTSYESVIKILDSLRTAGVQGVTLLTAQPDSEHPGALIPPRGLEMLVASRQR